MIGTDFNELIASRLKEIHEERFGIWAGDILLHERLLFLVGLLLQHAGNSLTARFGNGNQSAILLRQSETSSRVKVLHELPPESLN